MKQGYNARLDDSLGAKHGKKSQSMKARRDESEGMEKSMGRGRPESVHKVLKHMNADLAYMPVIDREKDAMKKGDKSPYKAYGKYKK